MWQLTKQLLSRYLHSMNLIKETETELINQRMALHYIMLHFLQLVEGSILRFPLTSTARQKVIICWVLDFSPIPQIKVGSAAEPSSVGHTWLSCCPPLVTISAAGTSSTWCPVEMRRKQGDSVSLCVLFERNQVQSSISFVLSECPLHACKVLIFK